MLSSLDCIYMGSKKQTAKVSRVTYLLKAYDKCQKAEMKRKRDTEPRRIVQGKAAVRELKAFVKRQKTTEITPLKERVNNYSTPRRYYKPPLERTPVRRSDRKHTSPKKVDPFAIDTFTGKPPGRDEMWRKEALIELLDELKMRKIQITPFTKKIVEKGKSDFKSHDGISKMYRNWKSSGQVRERGRPIDIKVKEAVVATKDALMSCSHDSSAFKLVHMKEALIKKKKKQAEEDGLDPETVRYTICNESAKVAMVAAAMEGSNLGFTTQELQIKTEPRYRSEHSVMMGMSYALTCLTTHYFEGSH